MKDPLSDPLASREDEIYVDPPLVSNPVEDAKRRRADLVSEKLRREHNDLATVLGTKEGQRVIMRILTHCGIYKSVYDPMGFDAAQMAYKEGQRNVGLWLIHLLHKMSDAGYAELLALHAKDRKTLAAEDEAMLKTHPTV